MLQADARDTPWSAWFIPSFNRIRPTSAGGRQAFFPWPIAGNLKPADWLICSQHNRALKGEAKLWEPVHASEFCRGKEGGSRKGNMCRIAYETNE